MLRFNQDQLYFLKKKKAARFTLFLVFGTRHGQLFNLQQRQVFYSLTMSLALKGSSSG